MGRDGMVAAGLRNGNCAMEQLQQNAVHGSLLATLLSDETFHPAEPRSIDETGLSPTLIEDLMCKFLLAVGSANGREIAAQLCLPFVILEDTLRSLRSRQLLVHTGSAQLGDYVYTLTEQGRTRALSAMASCGYVGAAPVTLAEYVLSVEAQTVRAENPRRGQLEHAFADISVTPELFDSLGPAVNSGAGLFLYGEPGNGKTTLAKRITSCFGQTIYVPRTVAEDGQIIKVYDAAYHEPVEDKNTSLMKTGDHDQRWVRVRRPTVVVGGELTLDSLEIRHDPHSNISEAPIQMKSNCGCLLIDDFGRQRVEPQALLNRWIVPLENRVDYLTLSTGKKIQIPFEQLIIFSTNLEPKDLVDEAFLRRIPYKIEITDPDVAEFHRLFESYAATFQCQCKPEVVDWLLATHYRPRSRAMRRCHPRDLLSQVRNYCTYNDFPVEMRNEYFDRVVPSYFTVVNGVTGGFAAQVAQAPQSPRPPVATEAVPGTPPAKSAPAATPPQASPSAAPAAESHESTKRSTETMPGVEPLETPTRRTEPPPSIAQQSPRARSTESMPGLAIFGRAAEQTEEQGSPAEPATHASAPRLTEPPPSISPPRHTEPVPHAAGPRNTEAMPVLPANEETGDHPAGSPAAENDAATQGVPEAGSPGGVNVAPVAQVHHTEPMPVG
jgi:hypothetical protein